MDGDIGGTECSPHRIDVTPSRLALSCASFRNTAVGLLRLPPTVTPAGPVKWEHLPDAYALTKGGPAAVARARPGHTYLAVLRHVDLRPEHVNAPRGNASRECLNVSFSSPTQSRGFRSWRRRGSTSCSTLPRRCGSCPVGSTGWWSRWTVSADLFEMPWVEDKLRVGAQRGGSVEVDFPKADGVASGTELADLPEAGRRDRGHDREAAGRVAVGSEDGQHVAVGEDSADGVAAVEEVGGVAAASSTFVRAQRNRCGLKRVATRSELRSTRQAVERSSS